MCSTVKNKLGKAPFYLNPWEDIGFDRTTTKCRTVENEGTYNSECLMERKRGTSGH